MQLHETAHLVDLLVAEAQRLHALARHLRPDDVVVVEGHGAVVEEAAGAGLADVVHEGGEAHDEVGGAPEPVLQLHRLLEHGERVLVDVLVAVVLVGRQAQRRQLGQHLVGEAGVDEQPQAGHGVAPAHQLHQLLAHPLRRHDLDARGHGGHRRHRGVVGREAELGGEPGRAHHAQGVVAEGLLGRDRGAQHAGREVGQPAELVHELRRRQSHSERVDGEVAPGEVALEAVAEGHLRLARRRVVVVGAVRRDLDLVVALADAEGAELAAHVPDGVGPAAHDLLDVVRARRRRQVEVVDGTSEQRVAHGSADERQLVAGGLEQRAELVEHGVRGQHGPDRGPHGGGVEGRLGVGHGG